MELKSLIMQQEQVHAVLSGSLEDTGDREPAAHAPAGTAQLKSR